MSERIVGSCKCGRSRNEFISAVKQMCDRVHLCRVGQAPWDWPAGGGPGLRADPGAGGGRGRGSREGAHRGLGVC